MRIEAITIPRRRRFDVIFPAGTYYGWREWVILQVVGLAVMLSKCPLRVDMLDQADVDEA